MVKLTRKQSNFFHKPRTMEEIMNDLFGGDEWAANQFQNDHLSCGNLEMCQIENPRGKDSNKILAFKKKDK